MSPEPNLLTPAARDALVCSQLYALLAQQFATPPDSPGAWHARRPALDSLLAATANLADAEILRPALRDLEAARQQFASAAGLRELQAAANELFVHPRSDHCPPYETELTSRQDFIKNNDLADLMGFYRAFGLDVFAGERPDFIGVELEFLHFLALKEALAHAEGKPEAAGVCADAARKFLRDHLGRWAGLLARQLAALPEAGGFAYYRAVGRALAALVDWDCRRQAVEPERVGSWQPRPPAPEPVAACRLDCLDDECQR